MLKKIRGAFFLVAISFVFLGSFPKPKIISVLDFGAIPNDEQNDAAALRKAFYYTRVNKGTTLFFPAGVYDFRDEKAVALMNDVMDGKMGNDPEKIIFIPYYPYSKGLDFTGLDNITVEASGAVLLCDGWMEPVSIENCNNIIVRGLTVDYKRKPHSIGEITEVQKDYF